jgi:hypothetical protein
MKRPLPPAKPTKPVAPNPNQEHYTHKLDVESLFFKKVYHSYDDDEEITKEQYDSGSIDGWAETEHLSPSLSDLIKLVPPGISSDQIHIEIDTSPSESYDTFNGVTMYYTTPFDYQGELKKYKLAADKYEADKLYYQTVAQPQYKKDLKEYQAYKDAQALAAKEAALKAQLKEIEKKKAK